MKISNFLIYPALAFLVTNCGGLGLDELESKITSDSITDVSQPESNPGDGTGVNGSGTYKLYAIDENGNESFLTGDKNMTQSEAISDCSSIVQKYPELSIRCYFNEAIIFERVAETQDPESIPETILSQLEEYFVDSEGTEGRIRQVLETTNEAAMEQCKEDIAKNPTRSIRCYWDNELILENIVEERVENQISDYSAYFVDHSLWGEKLNKIEGLTRDDAMVACLNDASAHPTRSIRCYWNGVIYEQLEGVPQELKIGNYEGYKTYQGEEYRFILTLDITLDGALSNCRLNSLLNQGEQIRCYWDGEMIYERLTTWASR